MITLTAALTVLALSYPSVAQEIQQQPHISHPKHSQFRDIIWGDLNFVHTTDTHGWYAGHLNQKQYSGDWGDYISFSEHLREKAADMGVDLLFVDTGDKHDGNGLSDTTVPNGLFSTPIFNKMDYDLVTIGNHELYYAPYSQQEYEISAQHYGERYVSTNVDYLLDNGTWVPFGNRYRYFTTPNTENRVLALSFLFDFRRFNERSRVTPIAEVLEQSWFNEILDTFPEEDVDYLVVYGHIPVSDMGDDELGRLHIHLRRRYPNTVIQYFGGHSHIRDFAVYDHMATGLQSGRYCETIGWVSVNTSNPYNPQFRRRYIDFNKESFMHHSNTTKENFDTEKGVKLTHAITQLRKDLNLTESYGYVPESYLMNAYPQGHPNNIYTLLNSSILPSLIGEVDRPEKVNRAVLVNSGSIRYDLYKGEFTKDTEFIVSPFQNRWNYITLPKSLAVEVAPYLNKGDYILTRALASPDKLAVQAKTERADEMNKLYDQETLMTQHECRFVKEKNLRKGFTTHDDHGCDGDDVRHNSIPYYPSPNVIGSYEENDPQSDMADLVFYDFIQPWVITALNELQNLSGLESQTPYSDDDVHFYGGESTGKLLKRYFAY